ncbi:MAG: enoyl-CoA hydratase/isomerase family protein [Gemmatimonadetes bacterium]|nr:enoyl-CoA hydratase/isomerase family protein [Gemmatimonadota bacterium]
MSGNPVTGGSIDREFDSGVATIRFGHPKSNSMPSALLGQLAEAIAEAGRDPAVRVMVLASEGTGPFCAGASFDELKALEDDAAGQRFFTGFAKVILAMIRAPKFVLARVQGKATGGGVGLIAAADWSIATAQASVKLSELAVGIGPFVVGPVIEKKIGLGPFAAMSVDADWRSAGWCAAHGLYAEVRDTVEQVDEALALRARWLASASPAAMRQLKAVFWEGTEGWDSLLLTRAGMSGSLVRTEEARAAIARASGGR